MTLSETEQAAWFGAWSAAAAFLGGLVVYAHGKVAERKEQRRRRASSRAAQALHIASLLHGPTERLDRLRRFREAVDFRSMPLRTVEIFNIDAMQAALTDPGAFEGHDAAEFLAFLAALRKLNRHFYENTAGEGDQGLLSIDVLRLPEIERVHQLAVAQSERMWAIAVSHPPSGGG